MAGKQKNKRSFHALHRYLDGITVVCVVVTMIGSVLAGVSWEEVVMRAGTAGLSLIGISWIIVRSWASWEDTRRLESKRRGTSAG